MSEIPANIRRPALFGGSFDPVHIGHLHLADAALAGGLFDAVFFVPARQSPHKDNGYAASGEERHSMVQAAIDGRPGMYVLDWELEREGPSYTIDTVLRMRSFLDPDVLPGLILGDDLIEDFQTWKSFEKILSNAVLTVGARPGEDSLGEGQMRDKQLDRLGSLGARYQTLSNVPLVISASEIRHRIAEGKSFRDLLPPAVYEIIEKQALYR